MSKEDDKRQTVYKQLAMILNYKPKIEHQHIHMGNKTVDDVEDAVVVEETPKVFNDDTVHMYTTPTTPWDAAPKSSPFIPAIIDASNAAEVIILLRQLMEGKTKPKDVLMPVRAAMDAGVIRRPTWEEFCQEFGLWRVRNKSSFSGYTNPDNKPYTGADFEMMKDKFRRLVSEGQ